MKYTRVSGVIIGTLCAAGAIVVTVATPGAVVYAVNNPEIGDSCGVDVSLVLDASGSISGNTADPTQGDVSKVRTAASEFLQALQDTDSTARVTQFATVAEELAPATLVTAGSLSQGGVHEQALVGYYDPQPPIPAGVTVREGTATNNSPSSDARIDQYTNWDQGLRTATGGSPEELVVFITDGDPSAFDLDRPGDQGDPGPPPDVLYKASKTGDALTRAIEEADAIKSAGTRMLAIGVGAAVNNNASAQRLVDIAGPQVVRTTQDLQDADSLNDIDVALVEDFDDLAQFLRSVVLQLCSPSLTITKLAQSATDDSYLPAPGWAMTVTPEVPGGGNPPFDWILPDTAAAPSKTLDTNATGTAQFQWEPNPSEEDSLATVQETLQPGFTAGRLGNDDYRCQLRNEFGDVREVVGEFDQNLSFVLDPIGQEIVTCTLWNSFDYQPDITLTKVDAPTEIRGDLTPAAEVTSTFTVTNPGNTPLSAVTVTDDKCAVVSVPTSGTNVGDTNGDGKLDPGEAWGFQCTRSISTSPSVDPDGQEIENAAEVTGVDPTGTVVTDTATASIVAFNPAISLTKLVDGADQVTVPTGTSVTYTFDVVNTGNTPLGTVTLTDDTAPCDDANNIVRELDPNGNDDDVLDFDETWQFSCAATRDATVVNTAIVTAVPLNPLDGNQPFPDPNPVVTDTDTAEVDVTDPGIQLTKTVAPTVVLLNEAGDPENVTYTFRVENTGNDPLTRPADNPGGTKDDDWIIDTNCGPVSFVGEAPGDNGDDILDPTEIWNFACPATGITATTVNIATISADPLVNGLPVPGQRVSDLDAAIVEVFRPAIDVVKTALRPVVLDPDAPAEFGPDVPRRPAEYRYEVLNTGNVPLDLTPDPPVDDTCAPLVADPGNDPNGNGFLDVDEVAVFTCAALLDRAGDSNRPPVTGPESGTVENEVTVVGVPFFEGNLVEPKSVTATDIARVLVIEPGITLTKTASAEIVLPGDPVTYTFMVENTGDVGLATTGPQDDKCSPVVYQSGDTNGNGLIDGANTAAPEAWTYTCTRNVDLPAGPLPVDRNDARVVGIDPLGNSYIDTDFALVRVLQPAIGLEKSVSNTLVPVGTEVTYDFLVTNEGSSALAAEDVLAQITLVDASIPVQPGCVTPDFIGGDTNNDQLLQRQPEEIWTYRCEETIDRPTTNVAIVAGLGGTTLLPPLPILVEAIDTQFVQTFDPSIDIVKTAEPTVFVDSGEVTYTYEVTNTGDVPLAGVAARITDDTCSPVTYVSGDLDEDGLLDTDNSIFEDALDETWIFTCTTTVDETTTNIVEVTGTPTGSGGEPLCSDARELEPCDVTDSDTATVVVLEPSTITIIKDTTVPSSTAFGFTFGDEAFTLGDGEQRVFDGLAPGDYSVTETVADGWALDSIVCVDPTDDSTTAGDTASIVLTAGESVTCTFTNSPVTPPPTVPSTTVPPDLPATGGEIADSGRLAAVISVLGLLLLLAVRRRRTHV